MPRICDNCKLREVDGEYRYCLLCLAKYKEQRDALDDIVMINERHESESITSSSSNPEDY